MDRNEKLRCMTSEEQLDYIESNCNGSIDYGGSADFTFRKEYLHATLVREATDRISKAVTDRISQVSILISAIATAGTLILLFLHGR